MRYLSVVAVLSIAGCGSRAPAAAPIPPIVTPPEAKAAGTVLDDAMFTGDDGMTEHLVVTHAADGWIYESTLDMSSPEAQLSATIVLRTVTDEGGAFQGATMDITQDVAGVAGAYRVTLERSGHQVVMTGGPGAEERLEAGEILALPGYGIGQLARLCFDREPRTWTAVGERPIVVPAAEPLDGGLTRATLRVPGGQADLYCDGDHVLALEGPGTHLSLRDGALERFTAARRPPPSAPALPAGVVEVDRTVTVKGNADVPAASLGCSLVEPEKAAGRLPGVVFQSQGGKDDRDGDVSGGDEHERRWMFRRIAYALAGAGVASLRCDTRGVGQEHGLLSAESLVADGTAMLRAHGKEPTVDPKRLGLVGFQEGGVIAPRVSKQVAVRAIVMIDPGDQSLATMMIAMIERAVASRQIDQASGEVLIDANQRAAAAIRAGEPLPADAPANFTMIQQYAPEFLRSFLDFDPVAEAAVVRSTSVLLVDPAFVSDDAGLQRDVSAIAASLRKATGKKKNVVETKTYPQVDADLYRREAGDEGQKAAWWTAPSTEVVDDIVEFLGRVL
jgi:dienelactone hydrolase